MQNIQISNSTTPSNTAPIRLITGLFRAQKDAEKAIRGLEKRGYRNEDVNVLMSEETRKRFVADIRSTPSMGAKAAEGAGVGSAIGGVTGAIIAGIVAIAAPIMIPGLGLIISGPIVAALAGAGVGGIAGGLVGSLVGAGIPESHAKIYDLGLRDGGVLITVQPRTTADAAAIAKDWGKLHAENMQS